MNVDVDPDRLKAYSFLLFSKLEGAVTAGMVHLGYELGLYDAMAGQGQMTSTALARRAGLNERWVREWLRNQAAARLIDSSDGELFEISPEAVAVLTDPSHPAYGMGMFSRLPATMRLLDDLPRSFQTGVGYDYDHQGPDAAAGVERGFAPWFRNFLVPVALPALEGVPARLEAGAKVADIGCGAGVAVLTMAAAYPRSEFHGYDISHYALERAAENCSEAGVTNAHFHDATVDPLPTDGSFDLVTTFDCIHDMTHPQRVIGALRKAVKPDGVWLLVDIKARETFAENVQKNPMAAMMYGISVISCMASALSEPDGAGLGTLGLSPSKAQAMAEEAGFTRFAKLAIDHPINAFYEVRP